MTPAAELILRIGEYQLRNLQLNRVSFFFLDLREPTLESGASDEHDGLLRGSVVVAPDAVLETVRAQGIAHDGPIVLICENGGKSMAAAVQLAQNSFINVFVVEGGSEAL